MFFFNNYSIFITYINDCGVGGGHHLHYFFQFLQLNLQGNKTITDFNIKAEAKAEAEARKEKVTQLSITAYVNDTGVLEIEFYWAGRGSSRWTPPYYSGPLVSAISADFKSKSKLATKYIVSIVGGSAVLLIGLSFVFGRSYVLYKSNLQGMIQLYF